MKTLRILLIVLIPALGFVACQKSNVKPTVTPAQENTSGVTNSNNLNARANDNLGNDGLNDNTNVNSSYAGSEGEIYGSGDDDRDGGDKKKKRN